MKVTPIGSFGSVGVYIDDIDMDHMTEDQWTEIGKIFMRELLVVMRDIKITKPQYVDWVRKWGPFKNEVTPRLLKKYGAVPDSTRPETWDMLDEEDRRWTDYRRYMLEETGDGRYVTRIHAGRTEDGHPMGYFSEGDLGWHSNECSRLTFTPCVALLGWEHMQNSATGFLQSMDLYEALPNSLQSEIDEMVVIHRFEPGRVNVRELEDPDLADQLRRHFCPEDGAETPMVCRGINGRKGLHYSLNTRAEIKGMSLVESRKFFEMMDRLYLNEKWIFDHWYGPNHDLCLFDNSITMHRRIGGHGDRNAFRCQFDPSPILGEPYCPWIDHPDVHARYVKEINEFVDIMGDDFRKQMLVPSLG